MKIEINKPTATILIANYNNSKHIDQCLASVINQDYKKIEVIVVDDKSSDNSLKILNNYVDQIKLIKKNKKTGVGSFDQMNSYYEAFKESRGEIIFLLDSDDYFHLDKVSIIMNEFRQNQKVYLTKLVNWLNLFNKNKYKSINFPKSYKTECFYLNNDKLMKKINIKNRLIDLEKDCKSISKFFFKKKNK